MADKLGVTRNTIQNWEAAEGDLSVLVENHAKVWDRRLRQEEPLRGPVALVYADGPMVVAPGRRTAMLQHEEYISNAAALARAQALASSPSFYNPFVMEPDGKDLWNMPELSRALDGSDKDAPTLKNILTRLAGAIRRGAPNYVRSGPAIPKAEEQKARVAEITALAVVLEDIANGTPPEIVGQRATVDSILGQVRRLGLRPSDVLVSAWAQACLAFLLPAPSLV